MKTLMSLIFSFVFINLNAQTFSAEVSSDSILIGNYITIKFSCDEVKGEFEAPNFEDINIVSGPNVSMSTQIINGEYSGKKEITYHIRPTREGQITIPPAFYILDETTLETAPLVLNIYPNPDGIIQEPENRSNNFFFESFDFPFQKKEKPAPPKSKRKLKRL